jgi:hypothetical protein
MESSKISIGLNVEPMAPVTETPAVQGQSATGDGEEKPRRRPPPTEEATEPEQKDGDQVQHRIDSLA